MIAAIFDRGRREMWLFAALAVLLVIARAAVFLLWEHIDFNSDQAIVGLMAKHLSEFKTFPLFFYGQNYMLGVQAWIVAPFFWIARPSVAVLKTPLVILNAAAAVLLIRGISSRLKLRPAVAFVTALPFIVPTPIVAGTFVQTIGSSGVEPILYVLFLWMLRFQPLAFGTVLALGFLHREFTLYAIPALLVVGVIDGSLLRTVSWRWLARMTAGFSLVWLTVNAVKLYQAGDSAVLQAQMLAEHECFDVATYSSRLPYLWQAALPAVTGGRTMALNEWGTRSSAVVGSPFIWWLFCATMAVMLARIAWRWNRRREGAADKEVGFGIYLAVVGACAVAAYPVACGALINMNPIVRYLNMAVLLPIGCCAVFLALESSAWLKTAVLASFVVWGAANLADSGRQIYAAAVNPMPNPHRELTEFLLSQQIRYSRANYWDAYVVDFLSRERVIVASDKPVRIPEYERLVDNSGTAIRIARMPCDAPMKVASWCVQFLEPRSRDAP